MANKRNLQLASDMRTVLTRLIKKLRSHSSASDFLSLTERSTIGLLDRHKALMPSELAAMEKITTQSMSQILNHLSELGYIHREVSEADRRKAIITLSESGYNILHKVRNERDEWLTAALQATCTPQEQEVLREAVVLLARLVDFE